MNKVISKKEVLNHNQANDCWIIIFNDVYDITPFLQKHPGGAQVLLSRAGENATSFFQTMHGNNAQIKKMLAGFKVGTLPTSEHIPEHIFEERFLDDLVDRCQKEHLYKVNNKRKTQFRFLRILTLFVFWVCSFSVIYLAPKPLVFFLIVIQAMTATSLFGFVAHESIHGNTSKNKIIQFLLKLTWPIMWPFITRQALDYEHNSHHIKIGDPEFDFEVAGFSSLIRYSGVVVPNRIHKYQHKLAKFFYPFYANIITTFGGAKTKFWSSHNRKMLIPHSISITWTLVYYILIPGLLFGHWFIYAGLYVLYQCLLFTGIYIGAAINHFVPSVMQPIPKEHENKYGYYNCLNTTNFCPDSKFWFWFTGGFNIQIEHHLIPFIPVENLHKMIPIVKELCLKYNYPYNSFKTIKELWDSHYVYLRILSENTDEVAISNERLSKVNYNAR